MKDMNKGSRSAFMVLGFLFLAYAALFLSASISTGVFPVGQDILLLGISVMGFRNAYLYPHFQANDERSRVIREKGLFYSFFVIIGILVLFMTLFQFTSLELDGYQTVSVIATLLMVTVFTSFVVVSKRI